jgi:cytochrome oxidase Cu insertion factor (SCO1/SenC/PrrC family)
MNDGRPRDAGAGQPPRRPSPREELFALTALGVIILVTIAWWMLALWPVPAGGTDWVLRTRAVCFGSTDSGLPDAEGWALLIGQPIGMTLVLLVGWGRATRYALARMAASWPGRIAMAATTLVLSAGVVGASARVAEATASDPALLAAPTGDPADHPRLDRRAPTALRLTDQSGQTFDLAHYLDRGQPVLVTFAFAHCETVCPVLVREVLAAQRLADEAGRRPAVVVVTVDPWRDTPSRLPHVAHEWGLESDAHVLSGPVDEVLETLDAWEVNISRDQLTGEVTHPAVVYVVSPDGTIAFVATGGGEYTARLVGRV